jgi:hypothetical protein
MSKPDSVYVFGPIFMHGKDYLPVYKRLMKLCDKYFSKTVGTWPDFWDSKETPREFYDRTYDSIKDLDLFIAEVSVSSAGVGMECQMGAQHGIPLIALCKEGNDISPMTLGLPNLQQVITYKSIDDLETQLEEVLTELAK